MNTVSPQITEQASEGIPNPLRMPRFRMACHNWTPPQIPNRAHAITRYQGQKYLLRNLGDHLVFRPQSTFVRPMALFLPDRIMPGLTTPEWLEQIFHTQYPAGNFGRCQMYAPPYAQGKDGLYLFFRQDGSGFALDLQGCPRKEPQQVPFSWDRELVYDPGDLVRFPEDPFGTLCEAAFAQVNPFLRDPFVAPEERVSAIRWLRGSEEELRRLTRAILWTQPNAFNDADWMPLIRYQSSKRGKRRRITPGYGVAPSERLLRLCRLAFEEHGFGGHTWENSCASTRASHYRLKLPELTISAEPPTAHERAEAVLLLLDWLEGRVSDNEQMALACPGAGTMENA